MNQVFRACAVFAVSIAVAAALVACAAAPKPAALTSQQISAIVDSLDRSTPDRTNDLRRKPAQMLAFISVKPGMVALDVSAGGGYTTELLARAIGSTGTVYGQRPPPRDPGRAALAPPQPEGESRPTSAAAPTSTVPSRTAPPPSPGGPIAQRDAKLRGAGTQAAPMIAVNQTFDNPVPAAVADQKLDLVTLMFNYHDLGFLGVDRSQMNRAIFRALKPGGLYVVADHAGRPGTGISESGTLHRIEEAFLRKEVEDAGFKFREEGMFLSNPSDPRDRNTPEPPQAKDEFVLKFVKP